MSTQPKSKVRAGRHNKRQEGNRRIFISVPSARELVASNLRLKPMMLTLMHYHTTHKEHTPIQRRITSIEIYRSASRDISIGKGRLQYVRKVMAVRILSESSVINLIKSEKLLAFSSQSRWIFS